MLFLPIRFLEMIINVQHQPSWARIEEDGDYINTELCPTELLMNAVWERRECLKVKQKMPRYQVVRLSGAGPGKKKKRK